MKVSELIIKLKELKEIHGDVAVVVEVVTDCGETVTDEVPILNFKEEDQYKRFIRIS